MWVPKKTRSGQSMAEYAIVLTVVITAIVAMQIYVKRGLQGKVRDVTDAVGFGLTKAQGITKVTNQYEPYYAQSNYNTSQNQSVNEQYQAGGAVARNSQQEQSNRTGNANVGTDQNQGAGWQ